MIGDFRAPDLMRFGFTPLYLDQDDIVRAVDALQAILDLERWAEPRFGQRRAVT